MVVYTHCEVRGRRGGGGGEVGGTDCEMGG